MGFDFEKYLKNVTYDDFLDAILLEELCYEEPNQKNLYTAENEEFMDYLYKKKKDKEEKVDMRNTTRARWDIMFLGFKKQEGLGWVQEKLKEHYLREVYPRNVYEIVVYYSLLFNDKNKSLKIGIKELGTIFKELEDYLEQLAETIICNEKEKNVFTSLDAAKKKIITVRDLKNYLEQFGENQNYLVTGVITKQIAQDINKGVEEITDYNVLLHKIKIMLKNYVDQLSICSERCRWYFIKYLYIYMMYRFEKYIQDIKRCSRISIARNQEDLGRPGMEELREKLSLDEIHAASLLKTVNEELCLQGSPITLASVNPLFFKKQTFNLNEIVDEKEYAAKVAIRVTKREEKAFYGQVSINCKIDRKKPTMKCVKLFNSLSTLGESVFLDEEGTGSVETVIVRKEDGESAEFYLEFLDGIVSKSFKFNAAAQFSNITSQSAIFENNIDYSDHKVLQDCLENLKAEELMDYPICFIDVIKNIFLSVYGDRYKSNVDKKKDNKIREDKEKFTKIILGEIDANRETLLFFLLAIYMRIDFTGDTEVLNRYIEPEDYLDVERVNRILSRCGFNALSTEGENMNPLDVILSFALMDRDGYFEVISDFLTEFNEKKGEQLIWYSFGKSRSTHTDEKNIVKKIRK